MVSTHGARMFLALGSSYLLARKILVLGTELLVFSKSVSETFHLSVNLYRENTKTFRSIKTKLNHFSQLKLQEITVKKIKTLLNSLAFPTEASLFVKSVLRLCAGLLER